MSTGFEIVVSDRATAADRSELEDRLYAFNEERTGYRDGRVLSCFVRDTVGDLVAGLYGFTWGGYARIELLWVAESHRGEGLGRRLVEAAEDEARARECDTVVVTSHEFQAPSFYTGLGYHVVGATEDTPRGYRELLFQKPLSRDA